MTDAADRDDRDDDPFVPLVWLSTPQEAVDLCAALQRGGLDARPQFGSVHRQEVVGVHVEIRASQLALAEQILDLSTHAPQGGASDAEIERELTEPAPGARHGSPLLRAWLWVAGLLAAALAAAAAVL